MPRSSLQAGEERRDLALDAAGVTTPDSGRRFAGYAAVFNSRTAIGNPRTWGFYEEIAPGAFTKTIAEGDQRFLINHDSTFVVSRVSAGTLHLAQDQRGLLVDSALDDDLSYVRDLKTNLRNGNVTGMSFGFTVPEGKDEWRTEKIPGLDGGPDVEVEVRTVREAKLPEVSSVTFPAYEETAAGLRHSLIPALLGRGDQEAIRRAAIARPDLAHLLGYDPDLAPVHIQVHGGDGTTFSAALRTIRQDRNSYGAVSSEPAEATRAPAEAPVLPNEAAAIPAEPVASTRNAPSQHELAKARLAELHARLRRPAA